MPENRICILGSQETLLFSHLAGQLGQWIMLTVESRLDRPTPGHATIAAGDRSMTTPLEIVPGVWTSGEIRDRSAPEGRSPHHFVHQEDEGFIPDPYWDDLALVLKAEAGWVVFCGCCHAGLVNTLRHVERTFGGPIRGVVGGAHLIEADDAHLEETVRLLADLAVPHLWLNHCTGQRALCRLERALGERVQPFPVGTRLELSP